MKRGEVVRNVLGSSSLLGAIGLTAITQVGEGLGVGVGNVSGAGEAGESKKSGGELHFAERCFAVFFLRIGEDAGLCCW